MRVSPAFGVQEELKTNNNMYSNSPVSQPKFKEMNMIKLMRSSLRVLLVFLVLMYSKEAISQTVSYDPAPVSGVISICHGGVVTVTVNGTISGEEYSLSANPPYGSETLTASGSSLTFTPVTYTDLGPWAISVVRQAPFQFFPIQAIAVVADPTAPTLTLSTPEGSVNAGTNISATSGTAGSGGVSGCIDSYNYSIDGGTSWLAYTLGTNIATTSYMMPSVKIKALRSHPDGLGCLAETIYTWAVNSRVHDNTGATGSYYDIQQAIDATNTASGDVLEVDAGTFTGNIDINKSLTLRGANGGIAGNGVRGTESTLDGLGQFTVSGQNLSVTIDGFKFLTSAANYCILPVLGAATSDVIFQNNLAEGRNVFYTEEGSNMRDVIITRNKINNVSIPLPNSISAMVIGSLRNLSVTDNVFLDIGYVGIISTGTKQLITITNNTFTNVFYEAIKLFGSIAAGSVSNNTIINGNYNKKADAGGIRITGVALPYNVNISNNHIENSFNGIAVQAGTNLAGTSITINNNFLVDNSYASYGIYNAGTGILNATCNWYGSTDYTTVDSKIKGAVIFVPYSTSAAGPCSELNAIPADLLLTYTKASENVQVQFDVSQNDMQLRAIPGYTLPGDLPLIAALYNDLKVAIAGGNPSQIQAAALAVGDDIITEYYYMNGMTKVYLKTAGGNDLIKNKYWDKYLVRTSNSERLPDWANNKTLVIEDEYATSTNPMTGAVLSGWLNDVLGKDLHVDITFIHNGSVNTLQGIVAIDGGPVNVYSALPIGAGTFVSSHLTIQAAIDEATTLNGYIVNVDAGTYPEIITVNKELTILGPNVGINPNTTGRNPEAKITYPTGLSGYAQMMTVIADNVTIDGFTFDGKDYIDAAGTSGILGYGNNIDVKNNIVTNFNYVSVWISSYDPVNSGNGFYRSDIDVTNNYIHNADIFNLTNGSVIGYGIYMQGAVGSVTGNVVKDTKGGIQLQPYNHPNPSNATATVTNNTFEGCVVPMWFNYSENANARWSITSNNLVGIAAPTGSPAAEWIGLRIQTVTVVPNTLSFTGNTVSLGTANPTGRKYFFKKWGNVLVGTLDLDATYAANTWEPSAVITDGTNILNPVGADVYFYSKIQNALDDAASNGFVEASKGTFAENLNFVKSVTLLGVNDAISPNPPGSRVPESVIMPLAGRAVTGSAASISVTIKGFTFDQTNSQGTDGHFVYQIGKANTTWNFEKNIFQKAGEDATAGNWYISGSAGLALTMADNLVQDNLASNGISIWSSTPFTLDVQNNVWEDNGAYAFNLNGGSGTIKGNIFKENRTVDLMAPGYFWYNYQGGILLSDPGFNLDIIENEFYNTHSGVILFADVDGPINIKNNLFNGNYEHSIRASNSEAAPGRDLNDVVVTNNSFINYNGVGKNLINARADNAILTTSCNWFGSSDPIVIQGLISPNVTFVPYLTNGTDNSPAIGFQPTGSCSVTCDVAVTSTHIDSNCAAAGSINITSSGGTGVYTYAWTGTGVNPTSEDQIGLTAGTYDVTVTDQNGCTATTSVTILYLPVTNTTDSPDTYYATIQAAINAATAGDVIEVCAGVYNGTITIDRSLTLKGANFGTDPRPSAGSSRVIGGSGESRLVAARNQKVININADNVIIDGFEITQIGGAGAANTIETDNVSHPGITFVNNIVTNTTTSNAMRLVGGQNFLIQKNLFNDIPGEGIVMRNGNAFLPVPTNQRIIDNDIINQYGTNGGAIYTYGETDLEISGNRISAKYQGIAIGAGGPVYYFMQDINVHHNEITLEMATTAIQDYGIIINGLGDNINIHNNIISDASSNTGTKYALIKVSYDADAASVSNPQNLVINNNFLSRSVNENYLTVGINVTNPIDANCNWWNSSDGPTIDARISDPNGIVASGPWLNVGTDNNGSAVGFEPVAGACTGCPGGNIVTNTNTGEVFCTIQDAIDDAQTLDGHAITVGAGTYDEQVVVNKSVSITGVGVTQPIVDFTGSVTGKPTLFDVSSNGVTIDNIHFQVNLATLRSAIIATSPNLDLITIKNSLIDPYGTPAGSYGERNAVSVNYANYRVATGGVDQINFQNNTVTGAFPIIFRSAISTDESNGLYTGNTLTGLNQDLQVRFASTGNTTITGNTFNQGGVEIADANAGAGSINVSNNTFNVASGSTYSNALRLKNNYTARTTTVSTNTFTGHEWGISLENYQAVTIDDNIFTPIAASTTYRHITVNTKELSSASGFYAPVIGATITNNTFNGSGAAGGIGLAFYNHDNDAPVFNAFTIGSAGNENNFDGTIGTYIYLDGQTGPTAAPVTTMAPWAVNLDAQNNTFGGASPAAMTLTQLFAVEDRIVHKIDNNVLGFVLVKANNDYVTVNSFVAPATTQASIQRGIDAASSGFTVNVAEGTYDEINVNINKPLILLGAQADVACGSRGAESIIQDLTTSSLPIFSVNSDDVTINGFEVIDPWANSGIDAGATGPSNLNIKFNNIHNIGTLRGSGNVYAVRYLVGSSTTSNVNISDNCIDNISNTTTALGHSGGIWFGQSTSNGTVNNLIVERNTISNVKSALSNKATWGIVIGTGSGAGTGSVVNPVISSNSITNLIGGSSAHAIGLEGNTPGAMVSNNFIDNITSTFNPAAAEGVDISSNSGSSTVGIHDNSFTNVSYGIGNSTGNIVNATCNWYGSSNANVVMTKIYGLVTYSPYLIDGTDNAPSSIGFQPVALACAGSPVEITSLVATDQTCVVTGTITVNFSGGTTPYKIDWTGGTQVTGIIGSPYVINGLAAGNYTVTVTDSYGSYDIDNVSVIGTPVTNITNSTMYTTIQAAINAANPNDVIEVCAGTYNEEVVINKAITLNGAKQGVDPRPSVASTRTIGGLDETIIVALKNKKVIDIQADGVIIDGFQITQSGGSGAADAVKASSSQNNIEFKNNIVANVTDEGIQLEEGNNNSIHNNYIFNPTGDGITLSSYDVAPLKGSGQKILDNDISGSTSAYGSIYLYGTQSVEVARNIINTLSSGIAIGSGGLPVSSVNIHHNEINTELRTAYSAFAIGISIDDSGDNIMIHNNKIVQVGSYSPPSFMERYNLIRVGVAATSNPTNVSINENYLERFDNENYIYVIPSVTNRVDAECNWYGTNDAGQVAARIGGTGSIRYSPFLTIGTDSDGGAVGFTPQAGACSCPSGNLVTNTNTGELFCGIQEAIDDANTLNGHIITVGAGTYVEDISVTKELSITGPNAAIGACDGSRVPEAIIVPATNAIASGEMIKVMASNVTIAGFTIDGDNPALISGFLGTNGADINAAEGITTYTDNRNNLTVNNNIFRNLSYFAVSLNGASGSSPATSGNVISNNKFTDLGTYDAGSGIALWGGGVLLYNNQYAAVTNNCMTNVRLGVQTGNFSQANPGATTFQKITGNTIQARKLGIFHNLFYGAASPYDIANNTITGLADVNESTTWMGMNLTSLSQAIHTVSNNNINGSAIAIPTIGISVWNDQTAPLISGGTITGVGIGINVNNFEGYPSTGSNANNTFATIQGTTINGATIAGIRVHDNPSNTNGSTVNANINMNNIINGGTIGVLISGSDATATISGNTFTGNQSDIQADSTAGVVTASPKNNLSGSNFGIENLSTNVINGTLNYWNDPSGPGPVGSGTGVKVTTLVDFCPWLNALAPGGTAVYAVPGTISVAETGGPVDDDGSVCASESVTLTVIGATGASTYLWSTGATTASIMVNPVVTTIYSVTVSYGGCSTVLNNTINVYPVPVISLVSLSNVLCNGGNTGAIEVVGTVGPAPYDYLWNTMETTAAISSLTAGMYSVTMVDANQCTAATANYTITEPTLLKVDNFAITNETCQACNDGTITVNASGGTLAYMYSKNGGTSFQSLSYFDSLIAGTYSMVVKDANGCLTAPQQVVITEDGIYPDLTPATVFSSTQFNVGNSANQVIIIKNIGSGPTTAPIVFRTTNFLGGGMSVAQNLNPSVTIFGSTYTLNNADFDMVVEGSLLKFTSKSGVVIPSGQNLKIGMIISRTGGGSGSLSTSVNIVSGTGGGELNPINNNISNLLTKL